MKAVFAPTAAIQSRTALATLLREVGNELELSDQQKAACAARAALRAELAMIAEPPAAIALHPQVLARYEQQVAALAEALNRGLSSGQGEGASALRELVESVTVYRDETRSDGSQSRSPAGSIRFLGKRHTRTGYAVWW